FPVEYKRGRPKSGPWDEVQLCAQALCLEEMLRAAVPWGALFYGQTRRRVDVSFDQALRRETERLAARLHQLTRAGQTPQARYEKKCRSCSIFSLCLPQATAPGRSARQYLLKAMTDPETGGQG
ncbi:MAG: CRISPR-associated protein Cas4, partial [Deltaproteobacteria bacterium]|nr:CRISPR-associated protein Cas4 [Deltaproteobacteria bacterium]